MENKKRDSKSRSYLLAIEDSEFLQSDEMRPLRLALEFSKIDLALTERGIASTVVVFGSSRVISPEQAEEALNRQETLRKHLGKKVDEFRQMCSRAIAWD